MDARVAEVRPLILLIEKDELPEDLPDTGGDPPTDDTPPPPEDDAAASEAPKDEPPEDSGDAAAADEGGDDDATLDDDDDAGGGEESDPVGEQLRRERLYDAIVDIQQQCEQLSSAADVLVDRIEDKTAKMFAVRAKQIVDDTIT